MQGIYFSIITFLTVGFGDFFPTRTATQIILFPFALVGIAQLGNLIGMIVGFFSSRIESREAERRARFEREREEAEQRSQGEADFDTEMRFLYQLHQIEDRWRLTRDLSYNLADFLLFWLLGAFIFSHVEVCGTLIITHETFTISKLVMDIRSGTLLLLRVLFFHWLWGFGTYNTRWQRYALIVLQQDLSLDTP